VGIRPRPSPRRRARVAGRGDWSEIWWQ